MRYSASLRATPLLLLVLILTAWHAIRLWTSIAWYDVLQEYAPNPGPLYIGLSGAVWLSLGLILLWSISQKKAWAAVMLLSLAAGYTAWYWIDRLVLQTPRANWPFALLVNLVLVAYVLTITIPQFSPNDLMKRGP